MASCTQDSISSNGYFVNSKPLNLMRLTIACLQFHLAQVKPPISCDSDSCFESPRPCLSCCRHACQTSPFRCILFESAWCTSSGPRGHISGQLLCPPKHDRPQLFIRFTNYKLSDTVRGFSFAHNNPVCALVRKPEARAICHSPAPSLVKVAILSPPWSSSATSLSVMMAACQ